MKTYISLLFFLAALHISPILRLMGYMPYGRTAFAVDAATLIAVFFSLTYFIKNFRRLTNLDWAVLAYIGLGLGSGIFYFQPGAPTELLGYAYGIHYMLMPAFCYFAVKELDPEYRNRFLRAIIFWNLAGLLAGIY